MNDLDSRAPGMFAFGDEHWPGVAKLVEEMGELGQVIGKLMMVHGSRSHWSGDLRQQFIDELADVQAATFFVERHILTQGERSEMHERYLEKVDKFEEWHKDMDADRPPQVEDDD